MNWFIATIVYRIICGDGHHAAQFDEQLRLVYAPNHDEAFIKARSIGENEQETFYNQKQQLVQWQFVNVSELFSLSEPMDGAEIYSRIREVSNADAYTTFVHEKADRLQAHCITC